MLQSAQPPWPAGPPSPARGGRTCSRPGPVPGHPCQGGSLRSRRGCPSGSQLTFLPLLGRQHPPGQGLDGGGGLCWQWGGRGRACTALTVPSSPGAWGHHGNAALAGGIRDVVWAGGGSLRSIPTTTQTPHIWQRAGASAGSVMATGASLPPCAVAGIPVLPWGRVAAPGLPKLWAEPRSGAGLGEAALLSWPPLE